MLKWTRTNVEIPHLLATRKQVRHTAVMPDGSEWSLRKADDLYFLYIDGEQHHSRAFYNSLSEGKSIVQKCADAMQDAMGRRQVWA